LLTAALTAKPLDGITYDAGFAAATAAGVVATRVSNLVVTLDKIKYVMRQPGQNRAPFLRPLSDTEIVRHLLRRRRRSSESGGYLREEGWGQARLNLLRR